MAFYTAREGIDTLLIERAAMGWQAAATQWLDNVPGFARGIEGTVFSDQLYRQAVRFDVEILQAQEVVRVHSQDNYHRVFTADGSEYSARTLLLATGSTCRRLDAPGEEEYIGAGIHFCATCDGPFYKGQGVVVIGGGNSATEESLFLLRFVDKVTMLARSGEFKASQILRESVLSEPRIDVRYHTEVVEFHGEGGKLKAVTVKNNQTNEIKMIQPAGVFIFIGLTPNTGFLEDAPIRTDEWGFIVTGHSLLHTEGRPSAFSTRDPFPLETSVPGIFAAGDVRAGSTKQVASAAGEGASAALLVREYLECGFCQRN